MAEEQDFRTVAHLFKLPALRGDALRRWGVSASGAKADVQGVRPLRGTSHVAWFFPVRSGGYIEKLS